MKRLGLESLQPNKPYRLYSLVMAFDKIKRALLTMHLLHEPFVVLYALLPFILRKDLGASALQISILSALRPTLPIFSFYWNANRRRPLRINLLGAWILARIPFIFIPFIDSIWYIIFSCALYELFNKSATPALIEILKKNVSKGERENILTLCFVLTFLESIFLGFFWRMLDGSHSAWQWICCFAVFISLSALLTIPRMNEESLPNPKNSFAHKVINPWKDAFALLRANPQFARFQLGFMMGGFGLMLINPSLTVFYADTLNLSHSTMVTGRSILMGLGIVLSSYLWKEALRKSVFQTTFFILIGFAIFPLFLLLSPLHINWFYLSFILYGIAQAGSHILWNLSGTIFAQDSDSSPYSRVNILMVGLRGAIAPTIGGFLCNLQGPTQVFILGSSFCFAGAVYIALSRKFIPANTL